MSPNSTLTTNKTKTSFEEEPTWQKCLDESITLLTSKKTKFVSLYLDEPARTAEIFGPDNDEVNCRLLLTQSFSLKMFWEVLYRAIVL